MLNGQAKTILGKIRRAPSGERSVSTGIVGSARITRLFHIAQEMGGPLNVVLGRTEYFVGRGVDKETTRSLKAVMSQAQQLVELRRRLLDEARAGLNVTEVGSAVSVETERADA